MLVAPCIGRTYRHLLKPVLFVCDPEAMHHLFVYVGHHLGKWKVTKFLTRILFTYQHPCLRQNICGIVFENPVGLAAGFDKEILLPNIMDDVGFGREECGSITYHAYSGNHGVRVKRLPRSQALLINYGLKNKGITYAKTLLEKMRSSIPLFVSVAKTNSTETCDLEAGIEDYLSTLHELKHVASIAGFVLNISCPNSFGGEDYTNPNRFQKLIEAVANAHIGQPLWVKLPVDKPWEELRTLITLAIKHGVSGVIIANLTKQRDRLTEKESIKDLSGGISGKPTYDLSNALIGNAYQEFGDKVTIIGVGGIFSAEDAYEKIKQGASLVQLITGMIYEGPQLIGQINAGIVHLLRRDGFTHLSQAVGANFKHT